MARIELSNLAHSYKPRPSAPADWAVKRMTMVWDDGGAYALLGPSGCGKTTLLNIISGLVTPSEGKVLFDHIDVTTLPTERRNIAQVFQFPVIYDTMTVAENLAFPLRNRGVERHRIAERVKQVATMLDLVVGFATHGERAYRRHEAEDLTRPRSGSRGRAARFCLTSRSRSSTRT